MKQFRYKISPLISNLWNFYCKRIIIQNVTGRLKCSFSLWFRMIHLTTEKDKRSNFNSCRRQLICFSGVLSVEHSWNMEILYLPAYLAGAFWPSARCMGLIKGGST